MGLQRPRAAAAAAVFALLAACATAASTALRGVAPDLAARYAPEDGRFGCLDGGGSIPFAQVNDGYCDCRDGSDEPGEWRSLRGDRDRLITRAPPTPLTRRRAAAAHPPPPAGSPACPNSRFYCANRGFEPKLLNASMVDDGVCDCCDGSDEPAGACGNACAERAAAVLVGLSANLAAAEAGLKKRAKYVTYAPSPPLPLPLPPALTWAAAALGSSSALAALALLRAGRRRPRARAGPPGSAPWTGWRRRPRHTRPPR
jgi:protein kinase C substrate 80K-H